MPRGLEEINRDIEYLRTVEDALFAFLVGNAAVDFYNKLIKGKTTAHEKVKGHTLNYLNEISKLRAVYENERKELLGSDQTSVD